jgi:hypothetical protein
MSQNPTHRIEQKKEELLDLLIKQEVGIGGLATTLEKLKANHRLNGFDYGKLVLAMQFALVSITEKQNFIEENE